MSKRISVLFETEGTYPFKGGGVSVWSDILCQELSEIDFYIFAVTGTHNIDMKYSLPTNVKQLIMVPLWGMEDPSWYINDNSCNASVIMKKMHTTEEIIRTHFVTPFARLFKLILYDHTNMLDAAEILHRLYQYFLHYDYKTTFRSNATWTTFKEIMNAFYDDPQIRKQEKPTIADLTVCLRFLHHYLIPINIPIPRTDITHTSIAGFCGLASIISKIEFGSPMIVTDHGVFLRERYIAVSSSKFSFFKKKFLIQLSTFVSRLCYFFADQISPVCNFNKKWEIYLGAPEEKIKTIYNGIDPAIFTPGVKPAENKSVPTVVAATHIMKLKDIKTMIKSCYLVKSRIPDVRYLLYGSKDVDPDYVRECEYLILQLKLSNNFFLCGFHSNKAKIYNSGDVCILTSISEGFPYTILESMSCAKPVVATDVGGVGEAIKGVGILTKPRDVEAIAKGVLTFLQDDEFRINIGRQCRERVLLHFRISHSVDAYRESYQRLVINKGHKNIATDKNSIMQADLEQIKMHNTSIFSL